LTLDYYSNEQSRYRRQFGNAIVGDLATREAEAMLAERLR
jgi:hypothetical protein